MFTSQTFQRRSEHFFNTKTSVSTKCKETTEVPPVTKTVDPRVAAVAKALRERSPSGRYGTLLSSTLLPPDTEPD